MEIFTETEWEIVDPSVDESKFVSEFDKRFIQSDTWKLLLTKYPNDYEERYERWKSQFNGREPSNTDIGVFRWQILHKYLPRNKVETRFHTLENMVT